MPAAWQFYLQRVSVAVRKVGTEMGLILGNGRGLDTWNDNDTTVHDLAINNYFYFSVPM